MNWFNNNYLSIISFVITIIAAATSFISSDKNKKAVAFVVAFLGALFTLINTINANNQSKLSSIRADSLQKIINQKADLIAKNQNQQDSSFKRQFEVELDTLQNVNNDLLILKFNSKQLNDTLKKEVLLQKQTNKAATQLF